MNGADGLSHKKSSILVQRGQIDRYGRRGQPSVQPAAQQPADGFENERIQPQYKAVALKQRDKIGRRDHAAVGPAPAHQGLGPGQALSAGAVLGLQAGDFSRQTGSTNTGRRACRYSWILPACEKDLALSENIFCAARGRPRAPGGGIAIVRRAFLFRENGKKARRAIRAAGFENFFSRSQRGAGPDGGPA